MPQTATRRGRKKAPPSLAVASRFGRLKTSGGRLVFLAESPPLKGRKSRKNDRRGRLILTPAALNLED